MIQLRDYQITNAGKAVQLLRTLKIAYLAMEVRTGKTLTALKAANDYGAKKVLFLTKKKAVESGTIQKDYNLLNPSFDIVVINNESLHKVKDNDFDLLISDEHHRNSGYPKPNKITKTIKERFGHLPMIFLSGTPAIESGSQWYHSFWVSNYTPFKENNFYRWAEKFTTPATKHFGSIQVKDYSKAKDYLINPIIEPYILKFTQKEAGFAAEISEHVIYFEMPFELQKITEKLLKNEFINFEFGAVVANNAGAMLSKIHQLQNGTVITENDEAFIVDTTKANFIKDYFKGKKIAIFYYFQKEKELLLQVFGDKITTDIELFNTTDKNIAIQQISGSEAISLKHAEALVYYNFGYSGRNYTQGRDRMTTKDRSENNVYFVLSEKGINERIYKTIKAKKKYNDKLFIRDYKWQPKQNYKLK